MLALYRSGRQAEALAVYREACGLLRGELGLTPSAELQELERMILRQDAGLDVGPRRHARPPMPCPFKGLAPFESSDADFFCGRDRIVSELIARLAEWPLVGILGPPGSASLAAARGCTAGAAGRSAARKRALAAGVATARAGTPRGARARARRRSSGDALACRGTRSGS